MWRLRRSSQDSILADPIIFRICPVRVVCSQPSFIIQNRGSFPNHEVDAIKCIWLPLRHEMRAIAQKYLTDISLFHHIIHVPTFHSLVEDVYSKLESNSPVEVGRVLLLVSMCASATYAWSSRDDPGNTFSSVAEANSQSLFWVKQALDVSDHAQRISQTSMEAVQGLIILFFVICNHESVSQRARNVIMIAISAATELQLHRIDGSLPVPTSPLSRMSQLKKEIGRRIWWYLVTMDWLLAHFNPLQEGFCVLHADQMAVNLPKNVRDEDLIEGREVIERPMTEPTCVSYLIQRIRLAELTQWMTERHSRSGQASQPYSSRDILETDMKLKEFIGGIPDFLSLDSSSLSHLPPTDPRRSPLVAAQRYALNLILHRQLCKMHLPYLAQGTVDPAYAYSRDVCLRSASVVIGLDHKFLEEHLQFCISKLRISMVLRSVFLASIALALNACVKSEATDGVDGLDDAAGPWKMLMEAYDQSPSGSRLLELSIQLLRKYKIKHDPLETLQRQMREAMASTSGSHPMGPESGRVEPSSTAPVAQALTCAGETEPAMMETSWQRCEGKPQLDMGLNVVDWDKLFWGSDAPFI
ncbi:putative transcriptional regulatory protein [Escovopsis weberi]|uniref:Putative transcriptional regulatory protein n=1 Tax=Escovopsis weberi TaxID=150374 RepID=A0A0M8MU83_ESCWE|nr:putative transcriptional regulatory protein [Escovopsis weberi]